MKPGRLRLQRTEIIKKVPRSRTYQERNVIRLLIPYADEALNLVYASTLLLLMSCQSSTPTRSACQERPQRPPDNMAEQLLNSYLSDTPTRTQCTPFSNYYHGTTNQCIAKLSKTTRQDPEPNASLGRTPCARLSLSRTGVPQLTSRSSLSSNPMEKTPV